MSFIDTFKHKEVAIFLNTNIYITNEDVFDENILHYSLKNKILFGGGSGEFPMAIISPLEAVKSFINKNLKKNHFTIKNPIKYINYEISDFQYIEKEVKKCRTPIPENQNEEDFLLINIGQFIFFSMPELYLEELAEELEFLPEITPLNDNIFVRAPNCPNCYGKKHDSGFTPSNYWWD